MSLLEPHSYGLRSLVYIKSTDTNRALIMCQSYTSDWSQQLIKQSKTPAFIKIDQITAVF